MLKQCRFTSLRFATCLVANLLPFAYSQVASAHESAVEQLFKTYCFDCHDDSSKEAGLDLTALLKKEHFDGTLIFENLITGKMPPADAEQPSSVEKQAILKWLAGRQKESKPNSFRRISRHEFVHSLNDLLGTNLDLANEIPEDRGTSEFDSDRRIQLSREMLSSYFTVADKMLENAFPTEGFPEERVWITNKLKDSHKTYNIYVRDYEDGVLFSWTRANNGNSYSFFYDNFDPPAAGWYELTFDAAKIGDFREDVSIQVYAGKYYYADDRPQPQRLLDVISLSNREPKSYSTHVFLNPGENVSVHCYSRHTFRKKDPKEGAYIRQLKVRGPLHDEWPPKSFQKVFGDLPIESSPKRERGTRPGSTQPSSLANASGYQSNLKKIGGSVTVSSFQSGMEKEKMQDGSNRTFWHTRFKPTLAEPPHFIVIENPNKVEIRGLSYATWSGGNGNGQIKAFSIFVSDDGKSWGDPIIKGELEIRLANEQPILFPNRTTGRFIKFLVTDAFSLDGRSLASIGKLDVIVSLKNEYPKTKVRVAKKSPKDLKNVIRRFAEQAFCTRLTDTELQPYVSVGLENLHEHHDLVRAAKVSFKAVICSPRFLMSPGEHVTPSHAIAAELAHVLWLSVPDDKLLDNADDGFSEESLRSEINRMLGDDRSERAIHSFCDQWLNLRSWDKVSPSLKLYPQYDDLLHHYLPLETQMYLRHLIQENQPVDQLIDSNYTFLNQRLARHYDIDGIYGQQLRKVSFEPDVPRGGLLTMGSILKITTDGFDTSPILRGAWVSKNIVGTPISPPPETVKAIEPEHGEATTLREQIEQHKSNATCYACHKSIDPYGFALESFDATGQWRDKYRIRKPHKGTFQFRLQGYFHEANKVETAGEISGNEFEDVFGLKKLLQSGHQTIGYNFAKKFFEYASGYKPNLRQRTALYNMLAENPDVGWSASQIDLPLRSAPAGRSEKLTQREQVFSNKKPNKRGMKDLVTDVLMFVLNAALRLADRESDR